jgi:hypothetical protein
MRRLLLVGVAMLGVLAIGMDAATVRADDLARDDADGGQVKAAADGPSDNWRLAVTPRFQALYFIPHLGQLGTQFANVMPSYGVSWALQKPGSSFSFSGAYFYGQAHISYIDRQITGSEMDYSATRSDLLGYVEYMPNQSNVTFLAGLRYVHMPFYEKSLPSYPFTFVSKYELTMTTFEVGVRIAARTGLDSKHALSAQATVGVGLGNYEEHTTGLTPIAISGNLAETAEFALGYTYLWTESFSLGARVRAFLFKIDAEGGRPPNMFGERVGAAFGPEINATYRF